MLGTLNKGGGLKKYFGYLKPWEVSRYLGIAVEEVRTMIETGELPSTTIDGEVRVPWDQLEAWLDQEIDESQLSELGRHLEDVTQEDVDSFIKSGDKEKKKTPRK